MGLQHVAERWTHLDGLCVWALVREPVSWVVSALNHEVYWHHKTSAMDAWTNGNFFKLVEQDYQVHWFPGAPLGRGRMQVGIYAIDHMPHFLYALQSELATERVDSLRQLKNQRENKGSEHSGGLGGLNQILRALHLSEAQLRGRYPRDQHLYECVLNGTSDGTGLVNGARMVFDAAGSLVSTSGFASSECTQLLLEILRSPAEMKRGQANPQTRP